MFLHQELGYDLEIIRSEEQAKEFFKDIYTSPPLISVYDTETTGLNIGLDKPFLFSVAYRKKVAVFEPTPELVKIFLDAVSQTEYLFAHNAKYDYHMLTNYLKDTGVVIPEKINFADSIHVARYTEYSDVDLSLSLEAVGKRHVAPNAKFGGEVIRGVMKDLRQSYKDLGRYIFVPSKRFISKDAIELEYNTTVEKALREPDLQKRTKKMQSAKNKRDRELFLNKMIVNTIINVPSVLGDIVYPVNLLKKYVNNLTKDLTVSYDDFYKLFMGRDTWDIEKYIKMNFVDNPDVISELFGIFEGVLREPTYEDIYKVEPELMINYAADDVVILIEYLRKAWRTLTRIDKDLKLTKLECDLLRTSARAEQEGIYIDTSYLIESKKRLEDYLDDKYRELYDLTGLHFTVNQNDFIKNEVYQKIYGVEIPNSQKATLENIQDFIDKGHKNYDVAVRIGHLIANMRSAMKSLSTSVIGKLNQQRNGKIFLDTKNWGTVTGRVSNDMQQYPSGDTLGIDGEVLFSPRQMVVAPEDYNIVSIDYSQMEIRAQAQYTINIGSPEITMLKSVMPYKCISNKTGAVYDKNKHDLDSGEWFDPETDAMWEKIDLHSAMALNAFPNIKPEMSNFKQFRDYAKRANFLIIYGGGIGALKNAIGVDYEVARSLSEGFSKTFPNVRTYQEWVANNLLTFKYAENFVGRRYYFQEPSSNSYKAFNYLIQGGTAYVFKERQTIIDKYLKNNNLKSRMVMPIHDEMMYYVHKDEMHIVEDIKAIMEYTPAIPDVPMVAEVDISETSWADLKFVDIPRKNIKYVKIGD